MNTFSHTIAVTAIIEFKGRFLFVQRPGSEGEFNGQWVFPGGRVHNDEDVVQALARELKEEVGLEHFSEIAFLSAYRFTRKDGSSTQGLVFLVSSEDDKVRPDTESVSAFRWIEPSDVLDFLKSGTTIYGMEVHVRNAVLAKKRFGLPLMATSVSVYQQRRCVMTKEYFAELMSAEWDSRFLREENWIFPNAGKWRPVHRSTS